MANIDTYLQAIMDAVYGEQVRGSIHDAIALINDVSEAVLTVGIAVDSPTSSSTGFFEDSLYVNSITWDLWKCTGTDTWSLEGNIKGETGNGIVSVTKTSTSDLVDTYTILFTDGTMQTFTVTNGIDGNRWFRGTDISGKAVNPTVYVNSGITDARPNDYYLNPSEGAVYYCVTGGDASTATWSYELTMSGGGGGGNLSDLGDVNLVNLDDNQLLIYDTTTSKWVNVDFSDFTLGDLGNVNVLGASDGQFLGYDQTSQNWVNKSLDKSIVKFGGTKTFAQLTSALLTADNEDKFFLITDGGVISSADIGNWTSQFAVGEHIPPDSHIAVINVGTEANPDYRFDDFGGYVDNTVKTVTFALSVGASTSKMVNGISGDMVATAMYIADPSKVTSSTVTVTTSDYDGVNPNVVVSATVTAATNITLTFAPSTALSAT